jgi:hypothetical protein
MSGLRNDECGRCQDSGGRAGLFSPGGGWRTGLEGRYRRKLLWINDFLYTTQPALVLLLREK